eukprot:scaffold35322_cov313-Amphora_coffeaeformis.AAC.1
MLRHGKLEESMYLLKTALAAVQAAGTTIHNNANDNHNMPCDAYAENDSTTTPTVVVSVPLVSKEDNQDDASMLGLNQLQSLSSCDMFCRGFLLEGPASSSLANTDENAALCAAVGLYNMALTMQLKGMLTATPLYWRKAANLYQKVFTILRASESVETAASLFLASILNLIACECELNGPHVKTPWKQVYTQVFQWATTDSATAFEALAADDEDSLQVFSTAAVMLTSQSFCTAPAA